MRFFVLFMAAMLLATPAALAEWYDGGTLQKATVAEWRKASAEDQLATSGDFIAALEGATDIAKITAQDQQRMKQRATDLRACVNQTISAPEARADQPVAELVIFCTILKKK